MSSASKPEGAQNVDCIIHAKWLIPMTEKGLVLYKHSLVIQHQLIREILPTQEARKFYVSDTEFFLDRHVLIPGLINAHGHAPMTLLRGFADDMPLQPWLEEKIWPAESKWVNESFVNDGAELAIAEMLLNGTTAFTDMYYFPDQVAKVALKANIRALLASPILDFPTIWAQDAEEYIHKATALRDQYKNNEHIQVAFGPHSTYTVSDEPLKKVGMLANELDIPIHMHVHETAQEVDAALEKTGKRPLQRLYELGLLSPNLQCVHLTQANADDIAMLAKADATVIHCPASNMKLGSGNCPSDALLKAGVKVALGTDGCASNNELNMFNEMRMAALTAKAHTADASALSAWEVLYMATQQGADAMGLGDKIGSLQAGKYADLTAVDLDFINTQPVYNPVSTLVYSARAQQVSHVWVAGKLNVEDHRLLNLDLGNLLHKAQAWGDKIRQE